MSAALLEPDDAPDGDAAPLTEDEAKAFSALLDGLDPDPEILEDIDLHGWLSAAGGAFAIDLATVRAVVEGFNGHAEFLVYGSEVPVPSPFSAHLIVPHLLDRAKAQAQAESDTAPAGFPHAIPSKPYTPSAYL